MSWDYSTTYNANAASLNNQVYSGQLIQQSHPVPVPRGLPTETQDSISVSQSQFHHIHENRNSSTRSIEPSRNPLATSLANPSHLSGQVHQSQHYVGLGQYHPAHRNVNIQDHGHHNQSHGVINPLKLSSNSPISVVGPIQPHTPVGLAGVNPFGNGLAGTEQDLPRQLLDIGWRKFWSRRENRWYFWNHLTGESLWEVPPLPGRHPSLFSEQQPYDPLTDPLGIQCGGAVQTGSVVQAGTKRRASLGEHIGSPSVKKFILAGPWDLEVPSNVFSSLSSTPLEHLLPPHPEAELNRSQLVAKLRQCYQQSCYSREGINAPKESLNRWMIEQKITNLRGIDPIFPSCGSVDGIVSPLMFQEIMNDIPMKVVKPRFTGDARKQLAKFADACKRTIETRNASAEARKVVKWKAEETFSWLKATSGAPYEAFQERLMHLKMTCQPHVHKAAKSSVEGICRKMSVLAKQYAETARETHLNLYVKPTVKVDSPEVGRFRCQPAVCGPYEFTEAFKMPHIEFLQEDRDRALLKFRTDSVRITTPYLQKLEQLYRYNCVDDRKFDFFLARSYCLLKRYNAYCEDFAGPQGAQTSLPVPVFESIQRNFGVTFECFSSPFNCYFRQYCSAFPDTDGYFGCRGTFLDYHPLAGSFELNPPFSEQLIDAAVTHVEELLAGTREPMSFIIFTPEYIEDKEDVSEGGSAWFSRLDSSRWKRKRITIPAFEHEFRHGAQHNVSKNEASIRAQHATVVFWLQNESGWEEWKPTDEKVDALIDAYRPGRERERDRQDLLSPERKNPKFEDKAVAAAAVAAANTST